ncbi:UDP-N-acetylglucosamine 1-carboxyvinyltransferase [Desulfosporosinus sp. BICA1-9]|uniref:UDP-N-acetylglucosamine 1-carboxyvinyltransferase n=1 Tax=Desulfosporosinus sp. BICA1-9 TaxID=1531958 RepID=UPI00054B9976|nr:UDP-N-acetylglucosamine 1-carboxyvinyltransferase [Desulfosporosinus sp. BICA1-9]KJS50785.1 MAG: UDP-N-acetylglucosamine 1-carboxyvinyltransferase [Peptococcaceae bacterium BRH_c23]KJS89536.1 MAG: UDP-N-acetylglucosamine 1-carboxyvinyltransferase [Desulfosporosinus sp. BICA1-9]HBW37013.1 UDP-N-acetylglucosamine 1-carboxyvinyltransferase [Desulfosporosinus sp.]
MSKLTITGGKPLEGTITVSGAKNAVLPIIAASLLCAEPIQLDDAPDLLDVNIMNRVISALGAKVERKGSTLYIQAQEIDCIEAPYDLVSQMRASIVTMGPLLARKGHVRISHPGGCAIGSRPINWHLKGLEALGAEVKMDHGFLDVSTKGLKGTRIYLDYPSVGATQNIMMAASMAQGTTLIENAAQEPEIVDLATFLNEMGGKVRGAGTSIIHIEGVREFHGTTHTVIPDRIEAGSFLLLAAATGGDVLVQNVIADHLKPLIAKMEEAGIRMVEEGDGIRIRGDGIYNSVDIKTQVHPGFPTDLQAPFMAFLTRARGTGLITETVFENRFMHVDELKRMGADIKIEGRSAIVQGIQRINAAPVTATDLRAGAALILAALTAEGTTDIRGIHHIDRGYEKVEEKLSRLGANITRAD